MILINSQDHRSRSNFPKMGKKKQTIYHISDTISPTDFIIVSKYNQIRHIQWPNWWWPSMKATSQGQIVLKIVLKNQTVGHILDAISLIDFILGIKVPYNLKRRIQWPKMTTFTKYYTSR